MLDFLRKELDKIKEARFKKLALAELLQHLILQSMSRQGDFKNVVFTGGTALRLLFGTGRYSEDLDFSLETKRGFAFRSMIEKIRKDLVLQKLDFEFKVRDEKTIALADIRFPRLLKEFAVSPLAGEKLTIKLNVDKNPPAGGTTEIAFVAAPVSYSVTIYDLPSLFATKLHAVFHRKYVKGRDYYDPVWFLGRTVQPNFKLLNNAIRQTEGKSTRINAANFKERLLGRLEGVDFSHVRRELDRFVVNRDELGLLNLEAIRSLLRRY